MPVKRDDEIADNFGKRLQNALRSHGAPGQKGYTWLAEQIGVSYNSVANYAGGHNLPTLTGIVRIAEVLGVTTDYLLTGAEAQIAAGALPYDPAVLREVIQTVEEIFELEHLTLPPTKKAELIGLLYEEAMVHHDKKPEIMGKVLRFARLAS